ncbi:lipid II:glycine glycyltransferase FemX [Eupransor demetentiae]|uniref:Lipid II:glycine glycyltransferase (Peptidoglycan interpeptide bridge formation enzyme) (FmhB) n=1 Tax=Eupransor demetentiae TaxID=3109584 RepID=A0ABP0ESK2_9LACO|nr:Lipid II:glycine glycyltransferase (Peptidoglycan interpeptide bridge formation enzyme) (FmhB) [Lactobacillaceae bacterium LMG 33000]
MAILDLNDKAKVQAFQDFVRKDPRGQVTQDPLWGDLKSNWGHVYVYHETAGKIDAAMAILTVEAVPGKLLGYSPRGPIADVDNIDLIKDLIQEALQALPDNVFLIRMDPEVEYSDHLNEAYQKAGFVTRNRQIKNMHGNIQPRKNMVLFYDGRGEDAEVITDEDSLMKHFKRDYRNQIRRAAKDGVEVTSGDSEEDVRAFYDTYVMMAHSQGITYRPIEYFLRMQELWQGTGYFKVFLAHFDGKVIAAGIGFSYGDKIWYMYAGSDREYSKHYAPYAIQWKMTNWGLSLGKTRYDFGGVGDFSSDDGLYKFKHGFTYHDPHVEYIGELDWVLDEVAYEEYLKQFK